MNKSQPKLMNFSRMRAIFEPHSARLRDHVFINDELGIMHGTSPLFRLIMRQNPPFAIDDRRLGIVVGGEARINLNLVEKHLTPGTLVYLGPGTIVSPVSISCDLEILALALFPQFPMPFAPSQMPSAFIGEMRDFQLHPSEADVDTARSIIGALWQLVRQPDYDRQTAASLAGALMHHYDALYRRHAATAVSRQSREQTIFDRFIYLVNQHAPREHQLSFYAEKMCLTPRYLGTVVRQASGVTAKEWIDRALITRIQVELRHTDKPISLIGGRRAVCHQQRI